MTPIKVRGKRHATAEEKWKSGRGRRKMIRDTSSTPSDRSYDSSSMSNSSASHARRTRKLNHRKANNLHHLSMLEQLPTEILHYIFQLSYNVELPFASRWLSRQLSSTHLYTKLTAQTIRPVMPVWSEEPASEAELAAAYRLMNSKFMTWAFFKPWLQGELARVNRQNDREREQGMDPPRAKGTTWYRLKPDARLLPPRKLLRAPFTEDNLFFLEFICFKFSRGEKVLDPVYRELAHEGLQAAVRENAWRAVLPFSYLGVLPDTELLRIAAIEAGGNYMVLREILDVITTAGYYSGEKGLIDFLDPELWAWAERAKAAGHKNADFLLSMLRNGAR